MADIIVRKAIREDCKALMALVQELANYHRRPNNAIKIDYKTLEKDGFGEKPLFFCYVAIYDKNLIGYAFCSYIYSPRVGRSIYMTDLYVTSDFRQKHVGSQILQAVAKDALENNCHQLDFLVLNSNPAQQFYKKLGASDVTIGEQWHHYCFANEVLRKLASGK
ncbi:PREDICTED: diamine acetyltransferase 2-like [Wasmannia auropunctata]|uniref:diamine acetyltransferase 2-like n=1 Tax=Wasmannia auropunctata TaxID=64793 RepID=UPI0005EE0FB4|nr:PREDICTED: diamine acetyltransferase 2-like [Wasmannia auropunctata]XP_011703478.1 PREDICTED: diamine acetyltransferase 2-like [Wasmannia auropunctata]XP_011703479.1 PREDICTED: diamine acetyltransferase 2-like [Wasmannia auropunctata]